jgi:hypothetical protein
MKQNLFLIAAVMFSMLLGSCSSEQKWESLFNGKDINNWTVRGKATWTVKDGVLMGEGENGHIYAAPEITDFEFKGKFKIYSTGENGNSGLYFRANPPADNPDGYPRGYEAQICNSQDAHTGWLWKPGTPTGKATANLAKDGEWFDYYIKVVGNKMEFKINDQLVMTYEDDEYKKGYFAIQCHNPGMVVEAKEMYYRDLSTKQ